MLFTTDYIELVVITAIKISSRERSSRTAVKAGNGAVQVDGSFRHPAGRTSRAAACFAASACGNRPAAARRVASSTPKTGDAICSHAITFGVKGNGKMQLWSPWW